MALNFNGISPVLQSKTFDELIYNDTRVFVNYQMLLVSNDFL